MNSLSWMIYAAEVAESLKGTAIAYAAVLGLFGSPSLAVWGLDSRFKKPWGKFLFGYLVSMIFAVCMIIFIPSSNTIYMIAASEAGETVVTSPEAKEMLGDLKEIIRRKLAQELKGEVAL